MVGRKKENILNSKKSHRDRVASSIKNNLDESADNVDDDTGLLELTYNWDPEEYTGGRNFGHLAYRVQNIYETCQKLMDNGVIINRPPRDGHMAFVRSPDGISIEILQEGEHLSPQEPWLSMQNNGGW